MHHLSQSNIFRSMRQSLKITFRKEWIYYELDGVIKFLGGKVLEVDYLKHSHRPAPKKTKHNLLTLSYQIRQLKLNVY